ncbi:MAG TPA: carboxypeptidase-like regulatory domain-containing protein [Cyclobacteriaceae bacterium]|nr:carboxypeptidase-like regulatory domain-containing protein [Cyclobacteriaceae bacterium]
MTTKITRSIKVFWLKRLLTLGATALFVIFLSPSAQAQSFIKISGSVIDKESKAPVPYVHIYTKSWEKGTVTDDRGHFAIIIDRSDTLIFSSVGFDKYRFRIKSDDNRSIYHVVIEMNSKTYELEPVVVHAYMSFDEFKQQILDLNIPTEKEEYSLNIPRGYKLPPEGGDGSMLNPSVKIKGPISALVDVFSKDGKERRRLESIQELKARDRIISSKYNLEVVRKVTHLQNDDAKRFMEWCKFEDDYILQASDYELAVAMLKCLDEFHKTDSIR